MLSSVLLVPALAASVFAAPTFPSLNTDAALPGSITVMSDYFNMLADKVQQSRLMSDVAVCDLSKAAVPTRMSPFPLSPASRFRPGHKLTFRRQSRVSPRLAPV